MSNAEKVLALLLSVAIGVGMAWMSLEAATSVYLADTTFYCETEAC